MLAASARTPDCDGESAVSGQCSSVGLFRPLGAPGLQPRVVAVVARRFGSGWFRLETVPRRLRRTASFQVGFNSLSGGRELIGHGQRLESESMLMLGNRGQARPSLDVAHQAEIAMKSATWEERVLDSTREKTKLLNRVRRIRGQIEAVERALEQEIGCSDVLQLITSVRGAINGLMAEVLEDHIRMRVVDPLREQESERALAAEDLINVVHSYLK
jgi:DNA-binding FrmR family transcriptional regulator